LLASNIYIQILKLKYAYMKKIYSLLIVVLALVSLQTKAQLVCTPGFAVQYLSGSAIKCNPVLIDTPAVQHYWSFGDGSTNSAAVSPTHTYATNGTFMVCHYVIRHNPNNVTVCLDSTCMPVIVQQATCNLVASYYSATTASSPLTHQYFNTSTNFAPGDSIRWTFGDGTTSTDINPVHTYSNYGVYNVCLRVKKPQTSPSTVPCVSEICRLDTIAYQCNLQAYFTNTPDSATAPATIQFTNLTTTGNSGIANIYTWNFGDGTSSNLMNPTHVYTSPGTYTVCLHAVQPITVAGTPTCSSDYCKQITITGPPACNLVANFNYYLDSLLTVPNSYHFTNTTTPLSSTDSIRWTFGDGTSSNQVNPTHAYTSAGTYNVCLRVIKRNPNGVLSTCISEKCYTIVVAPIINPCNLQVYFSSLVDSIQTNIIIFTNQSIGYAAGDSLTWSFGDGGSSNAVNPVHTYTTAGTYVVCLTIKKNNTTPGTTTCVRQYCKTIIVTVPCNLLATYTYFKDSSVTPAVYHFNNTTATLATSDSIRWSFGDGTFSNQVNPTHTFAQAGSYMVCLRVIRRTPNGALTNCVGEVCYLIVVQPTTTACTLVSNFTWYRDTLPTVALNTVYFTNTSVPLAANDSIRWTFGDGTISSQVNPAHVYAQAGTYTVCLRVIKRTTSGILTNCVSEICKVVVVTQICNIVANYTSHADSANTKNIIFTNTTIVPNANSTAVWSFGDGITATTWNATHFYTQPGIYAVCLRIQYGTCVSYKCDSITVVAPVVLPTCAQLSQYHSTTTNNTVVFGSNLFDPTVLYTWTFGDNTGAQGANATHTYATQGYYTACLTAYRNNNCATTTCKTVYIAPNCNNITLSIGDLRDSLVPNRITFTALSNTATTNQQWIITKVPTTATSGTVTINSNNPTYMFLDSGYYNVCVKATYANGCVKTICKTIHITQNMPGTNVCTLQACPNPASSIVNAIVTLVQPQLINATIYNTQNAVVAQAQQQGVVGLNTISINIANLPVGIYTIRVLYGTQVCYAPFVKQ
jgi:PKD repeat protein